MKLIVCVGSACHLKGAHGVVTAFQDLIREFGVGDELELAAGFCLGHCTEGVTCKLDDDFMPGVTPESARERFVGSVLPRVRGAGGGGQ